MNKSPKQITARFDGTCSCCGRHVDAGEPITWISRGTIDCSDCTPIKPSTDAPQTPQDAPKPKTWGKAFTWDETPPQINTRAAKPEPKPDAKPNSQWFPVAKSKPKPAPKPAPKPDPKPVPTHNDAYLNQDAQTQTVIDLLVTLVNAADRLTADQCESVRNFAFYQKHHSASESRRRMFAQAADALS